MFSKNLNGNKIDFVLKVKLEKLVFKIFAQFLWIMKAKSPSQIGYFRRILYLDVCQLRPASICTMFRLLNVKFFKKLYRVCRTMQLK